MPVRVGLTVLLPVTRSWSREAVIASIAASDIPQEDMLLIFDAPDVGPWDTDLTALGFNVTLHRTGNEAPPDSYLIGDAARAVRLERHRAVRRLTQTLVPDGLLLCIEDDGILPPDVYARLSAAGPNATGVQIGRHNVRQPGIVGATDTVGVADIDACGHYCLLTTGAAYKAAPIPERGSVDIKHTYHIRPLVVDWDCIVGHLTEEGVLWP